jgi:hypothetical protein
MAGEFEEEDGERGGGKGRGGDGCVMIFSCGLHKHDKLTLDNSYL